MISPHHKKAKLYDSWYRKLWEEVRAIETDQDAAQALSDYCRMVAQEMQTATFFKVQ